MAVIIAIKPKEQAARTAAKNDPTPSQKDAEEMRKVAEEARLQKQLDAGYSGAKKYARGGGVEQRGKTRGRFV